MQLVKRLNALTGRREGAGLDLGKKKPKNIIYVNPRAVLLVLDTMRLIGEIPVQSEGALQKAGFNFFFEGGWRVNLGMGSFGPAL